MCDTVMILRGGREVSCGRMQELRDQFGSITYQIFFYGPEMALSGAGFVFAKEGPLYRAEVQDLSETNRITAEIAEMDGTVGRMESHYPSLEEMLFKIGK